MKGIILAGGKATRLRPCTKIISKHLLPIYDKPMIYYPLHTLISAGIKEILIIVAPENAGNFLNLLGSGKEFGAKFTYEVQDEPRGLADAFKIGRDFIGNDSVAMILGDNIFMDSFSKYIKEFDTGARIFLKKVQDPQRFGVAELNRNGSVVSIEEKPRYPKSDLCITGLYIYDNRVVDIVKKLKPSKRGELEITDIHTWYLNRGELKSHMVTRAWIDAGTFDSLLKANILAKERLTIKF